MLADNAYALAGRLEADWSLGQSTAGADRHYGNISLECSAPLCPLAGYYGIDVVNPVTSISLFMFRDERGSTTYEYAPDHRRAFLSILRALGYTRDQATEIADIHIPRAYDGGREGFVCNAPSGVMLSTWEVNWEPEGVKYLTVATAVRDEDWQSNTACLSWGPS